MRTSEATNEIATALAAAQGEFTVIEKRKHAKIKTNSGRDFGYAYADISDVLAAVLPHLSKHGLSVIQPTSVIEAGLFITTRLMHASGQWIESDYPVCSINGDHQKMGGALTYSRRYALCSMLGVSADEDVDGQPAANADEVQVDRKEWPARQAPPSKAAAKPVLAAVNIGGAAVTALQNKARGMAREGRGAFKTWYQGLTPREADHVDVIADELFEIGKAADDANNIMAG